MTMNSPNAIKFSWLTLDGGVARRFGLLPTLQSLRFRQVSFPAQVFDQQLLHERRERTAVVRRSLLGRIFDRRFDAQVEGC